MKSTFYRIFILTVLLLLPIFQNITADSTPPIAETINKIANQLETGGNPDKIFSLPISKTPEQEVRVIWLDPKQWITGQGPEKSSGYIGLLTFVTLNAPFHRVQQALTAYQDAPKFTPGLIGTKVLEWKRLSSEKSVIIINRKRAMPALLAGLKDADYKIRNEVTIKDQNYVLARSSLVLDGGKIGARDVMQEMEGFEYIKKLDENKTLYLGGIFTLPNTGILPMKASAEQEEKDDEKKNLLTNGISFVKSKLEVLDVRVRFFEIISTSVLEDAFKTTVGLMKITTDPRWRDKWAYQLTSSDSKKIFSECESLLKKAKENKWIRFPS